LAIGTETQTVRAQAKWVRTSPRKARLVAEHIRGRSVPEARAVLAFTPRAAARDVEKVLRSAVANAEANHGLIGEELVVSAAWVDEGPTLKRWRARARGRVARIRKRTCHITLVLEPAPEPASGATRRGRRSRAEAAPVQGEQKRRIPTPRRQPKPAAEAAPEAVIETTAEPEAEAAPQAEEAPAEQPQAEAEPKPRRRPSVRRKKSEETEKES
jgi:ribosomal protein L22